MARQGQIEFPLWTRNDWPSQEVSGESFHEREIRSLFASRLDESGAEIQTQASLIPEPNNQFDPNAVMVLVAGNHVGYLPKEIAADYRKVLLELQRQGFEPVTGCRVWAAIRDEFQGYDKRGNPVFQKRVVARVSLVLDDWWMLVPANLPPSTAHAILPYGNAIQVHKEEEHQDSLRPYLRPQGETWVFAALHSMTDQTARTSKEVVEVLVDGQVVGQLTPAMSAEYLPVIKQLELQGLMTCARAIVKGNAIKADVVLHAKKANQLDSTWIATNISRGSLTSDARASSEAAAAVLMPQSAPTLPIIATSPAPTSHAPIPPKPTRVVFHAPPGWPNPPEGWEPPAGWIPPAEWPPAPGGWVYWVTS